MYIFHVLSEIGVCVCEYEGGGSFMWDGLKININAFPDYYPNCDVEFKGLPNIHTVRKSFQQLRATLMAEDQNK